MLKTIEKKIQSFVEGIGGIQRQEIVHGTLYVKLDNDRDCDFIHTEIRKFYKEFINPEGGVNMYAVGDEFAFDFVPEDRETPVFSDEPETLYGIWSEFAEEGLEEMQREEAEAEIAMELEAESKRGK
tara:strand:+ start:191 stop:571 length:381 start_codon:yes stop_codon:yes gene_type:complete